MYTVIIRVTTACEAGWIVWVMRPHAWHCGGFFHTYAKAARAAHAALGMNE